MSSARRPPRLPPSPLDRVNASLLTVIGLGTCWLAVQGCAAVIPSLAGTAFGARLSDAREAVAALTGAPAAEPAPTAPPPPDEPDWVVRFDLPATAGPPDDACSTVATIRSPAELSAVDPGAGGFPPPATPPGSLGGPPSGPGSSGAGAPPLATAVPGSLALPPGPLAPVGGAQPTASGAPPAGDDAPGFDTSRMLRWDMSGGATNAHLPDPIRARLGVGAPFDLATIAPEPLAGNDDARAAVRAVLARAQRGDATVRVQFWGASHVAGEFFTGTVRRVLQDRYGDAGHGFVMPAAPWKGYRASDVNLCSGGPWASDFHNRQGGRDDGLLGPAGVSIESADPTSFGWVQTTRTNAHGRTVSRFEVLFYSQPGGGSFDASIDGAPPVRVATAAPSSADAGPGLAVLSVPDGPHRLTVRPAGDGPVRIFGAVLERDAPGVVVDAMGVGGRTVASWLAWDEALQRAYLERRPPDLAVIAYGTNEANDPGMTEDRYRATLRDALARFRAVAPDAACVLVGPSDRGKKVRRTNYAIWGPTEPIARIQREVAPEYGCLSWDLQSATGGPGSMFRWREAGIAAEDLIHFTAAGYEELGKRFVAALDGA